MEERKPPINIETGSTNIQEENYSESQSINERRARIEENKKMVKKYRQCNMSVGTFLQDTPAAGTHHHSTKLCFQLPDRIRKIKQNTICIGWKREEKAVSEKLRNRFWKR